MNVDDAHNHHSHNTRPPRGRHDKPSEEARAVAVAAASANNGNANANANAPGATGSLKRGDHEEEPAAVKKVGAAAFADEAATPNTTTTTASEAGAAPALLRRVSSFDSAGGGGGAAQGSASPPRREEEEEGAGPRAARTTAPNPLPGPKDVVFGRGNGANLHEGNIRFRALVGRRKALYDAAGKLDKVHVVREVVAEWRDQAPPGRFLKFDKITRKWSEASREAVEQKVPQCFRDANKRGAAAAANVDDLEPYPLQPDANYDDDEGREDFDPEEAAVLGQILSSDAEASEEPGGEDAVTRPDALNDCILGAQGQSTANHGTRQFWEWVSQGKEPYLAMSIPQQELMAQKIVQKWGSCGGRFFRQVKILKRRYWVIAESSDAVKMVHRFMGRDWVFEPDDDFDCLLGRGGGINAHTGNKEFRATMDAHRQTYLSRPPTERRAVAAGVVKTWRTQGGRFLHRDEVIGLWAVVDGDVVVTMVQRNMCRNTNKHRIQPRPQQLPPAPVVTSGFAQAPHAAYMSARFSGGGLLSSLVTSSSSSSASASSSRPPKKGRIAVLGGRARRLLAPLLCLFGRGRER